MVRTYRWEFYTPMVGLTSSNYDARPRPPTRGRIDIWRHSRTLWRCMRVWSSCSFVLLRGLPANLTVNHGNECCPASPRSRSR